MDLGYVSKVSTLSIDQDPLADRFKATSSREKILILALNDDETMLFCVDAGQRLHASDTKKMKYRWSYDLPGQVNSMICIGGLIIIAYETLEYVDVLGDYEMKRPPVRKTRLPLGLQRFSGLCSLDDRLWCTSAVALILQELRSNHS
jgi:hypothetical protein